MQMQSDDFSSAQLIEKTTEELGLLYVGVDTVAKSFEKKKITLRELLMERLEKEGKEKEGKNLYVETSQVSIKREARVSEEVITEAAIPFLEKKGFQPYITVEAVISVRKGTIPSEIPADLLLEMKKYFDVEVRKTVSKDSLRQLLQSALITERQYKGLVNEKIVYALKVTKL